MISFPFSPARGSDPICGFDHISIFTPEEDVVLSAWFESVPSCQGSALPDLTDSVVSLTYGTGAEEHALAAAVAAVAMDHLPARLRQANCAIGLRSCDGAVFVRQAKPEARLQLIPMTPVLLFEINWADSGPGISWPNSYHVMFVPKYERFVVVLNADSTDAYGFHDLAIGDFGLETDVESGSSQIVEAHWRRQHEEFGQDRWAQIWRVGSLDQKLINALASRVWNGRSPPIWKD